MRKLAECSYNKQKFSKKCKDNIYAEYKEFYRFMH